MHDTPRAVQKFVVRATEYIRGSAWDTFEIGDYYYSDEAQLAAWNFYDRNQDRDHSVCIIEYINGFEKNWRAVYPRKPIL